jgi:hypothetical protein
MPELRMEEAWVQSVVASTLGVPVEQNDDGARPGMYDLRIIGAAGDEALEVTAAADPLVDTTVEADQRS